ncbi:hypothetical protein [Streptomyces sp. YGL11-2]|uniref:hypothetical protein n=1 Tax=Streptomyces sp. YGL11-2 TaxID=3414028 RepID=UPI003CF041BA
MRSPDSKTAGFTNGFTNRGFTNGFTNREGQDRTVKKTARINILLAGVLGLLLVGGAAAPAMAWGGGEDEAEGDIFTSFRAGFSCEGRLSRVCINGPVYSGNVRNAQNISITGNPGSTASPVSNSGSNNSGSSVTGNSAGSSNKSG